MHLFAPETGMMGTSGIVGPCILQAAGAGYSFKLLETDQVAVAFFGDERLELAYDVLIFVAAPRKRFAGILQEGPALPADEVLQTSS